MKYILSYQKLLEKLATNDRKMMNLVNYLELSIEEQIKKIPRWFEKMYPNLSVECLNEWCVENKHFFFENDELENDDILELLPQEVYFLEQYDEAFDEYANFLYRKLEIDYNMGDGEFHIYPLFFTISFENYVEDEYMVHFTPDLHNVKSILKNGFLGVIDMDYLAITAQSENDSPEENGFCFAYKFDEDSGKFHMEQSFGVIFRGSAINIFHKGDNEEQCIFIGNEINKNNLVGFYQKDNNYYTLDSKIKAKTIYELATKVNLK